MTVLALLLACREAGPWTREAALAPALARLDRDHDGRVTAAEYEATRFEGPDFAAADADGDGALSIDELDRVRAEQDPVAFVPNLQPETSGGARPGVPGGPSPGGPSPGGPPERPPPGELAPLGGGATPAAACPRVAALASGKPASRRHDDIRFAAEVMESLRAEVLAATPDAAVPSIDCLRLAAAMGTLDDPPARLLLGELRAASDAAGIPFPRAFDTP